MANFFKSIWHWIVGGGPGALKYVDLDLHTHIPVKVALLGKDITTDHPTVEDEYPLHVQVDLPKMRRGNVGVVVSSVYVPEAGMIEHSSNVRALFKADIVDMLFRAKFERNDSANEPFHQAWEHLVQVEKRVEEAKDQGWDVAIARSYAELDKRVREKRYTILHALEGAHHLGRRITWEQNGTTLEEVPSYMDNLEEFAEAGVCSITLGHFYDNDVVSAVNGLPPSVISKIDAKFMWDNCGALSTIAKDIIHETWRLKMVVDLNHTCEAQRHEIYRLNQARAGGPMPLVFSHIGVRKFFTPEVTSDPRYSASAIRKCPTDEEILEIQKCRGVLGVILVNYWLTGKEKPDTGMGPVVETIRHIRNVTGTYDNIAIGSDFDGFTDPIDDVTDISHFPDLRAKLEKELKPDGATQVDIDNIMRGNAMRVLKEGWR